MNKETIIKELHDKHGSYLLTKREAARELRVSPQSIDRMRQKGQITSTKLGGTVFFTADAIASILVGA